VALVHSGTVRGAFGYSFYLNFLNVTNRRNIYAARWDFHNDASQTSGEQRPIYMMPAIVSVGGKIEM